MKKDMAKLYINEKNKKGKINPENYGHFSEHLGRCIYCLLYTSCLAARADTSSFGSVSRNCSDT